MKKVVFLLSMLLLLGSWQGVKADVNNLKSEDGWTRLTQMPADDWADYYYVIADYHQNLMFQLGMGAKQEAAYNTLWLQKPIDPLSDQTVLFTVEKTVSASTGAVYWLLRCVAFPDYFLQTESGKQWHYRTHDNGGGEKSWGRLEIVPKSTNGAFEYFYMKNGKITGEYYLGAWETTLDPTKYPAGTEVALNKTADKQGHFLIYAIKKTDYVSLQQARIEAANAETPQDVTWFVRDPNFSLSNSNSCWSVKSGTLAIGGQTNNLCGEFFNCTFDISQSISGLPNGIYQVKAQGFYRVGGGTNSPDKAAAARAAGNEVINAEFYANGSTQPFPSVFDNMCTTNRGTDYVSSTGYSIGGKTYYVPTTMSRASAWFSEGVYESDIMQVVVSDGTLQLGARKSVADSQDWSIFDNFRLYYLGTNHSAEQDAALEALLPYEEALKNKPDAEFEQILEEARNAILNATTSEEIAAALNMVRQAYQFYLTSGVPTDEAWDLTSLLQNTNMQNGTTGWTVTGSWNTYSSLNNVTPSTVENYSSSGSTFALKQNVLLSPGTYRLRGYAFHFDNNADATAKMVAGDASVVVCSRNLPVTHLIPFLKPSSMHEVSEAFGAGNYQNELIFNVEEKGEVSLGFEGDTQNKTWFICGPVTLEKVSEPVLAAEAQAEVDGMKALYAKRKSAYTTIAAQHTHSGVAFTTADADAALNNAQTKADAERAITLLGKALSKYMDHFEQEFNLTSLIYNPSFEIESPSGWSYQTEGGDAGIRDNSNSTYTFSGAIGGHIFNTWITSNTTSYDHYLLQRIDYLPAGDYVLSATFGSDQSAAHLRMVANDDMTDYIVCSDKQTGVSATLDFTVDANGCVRIGAKSDHWFKADNFQLKYKPFKAPDSWQDVDLSTINLENEKVQDFLSSVDYRRLGATSRVSNYTGGIYDKPASVEIRWPEVTGTVSTLTLTVSDKADYSGTDTETRIINLDPLSVKYNLTNCIPGRAYYYKVEADGVQITNGHFQTEGTVRMIATEGGSNVRDLGGRITLDGRRVKYGRIYRGGEMHLGGETNMTAADLAEMARLGITAELDLRNLSQVGGTTPTTSAVEGAKYLFVDLTESEETLCTNPANRNKVRDAIHFIAQQLKTGNVYFHCIWGADRTGAIAFFVENILGCTSEDMYKDFELTSFSKAGHRAANWHEGLTLQSKIVYIQEHYKGATLQDKVVAYLKDCGVTDADIASIRNELLEDDAEAYDIRLSSLRTELDDIVSKAGATWVPMGIRTIEGLKEAYNEAMNALTEEVDMTELLSNAAFTHGTDDWVVRGTVAYGGDSNKCVEVFEKIGSVRQTLDNMPAGTYILKAQGYQNNGGSIEASYQAFVNGTASLTSYVMLNNQQQTLHNIFEDAQNTTVLSGDDAHPTLGVYAPNSLAGASKFFQRKGLYWNIVDCTLSDVGSITLGAAQVETAERDWTALDNFHLYYRGAAYSATNEIILNEEEDITLPTMDSRMTISPASCRTLKADGWNTLCLPFDMTSEMMTEAGITKICTIDSYDKASQTVSITEVDHIRAGVPYLVRVNSDWDVSNIGEVVVRAKQPIRVQQTGITFKGFYNPAIDATKCYYVSGEQFIYATEPLTIGGMQGTITLTGVTGVESLNINITDGIQTIDQGDINLSNRSHTIYDLQGRQLSKVQKGINIIVKDGKPTKMLVK